jgi:hypothetical protein
MGRLSNNLVVNFNGLPSLIGRLVRVRIIQVKANSLDGAVEE